MLNHSVFPLPPEVTRIILGGGSAIDQQGLRLTDIQAAREFALCYGYDPGLPHHRAHLVRVFEDALVFLKDVILDGTNLDIPTLFFDVQDPVELLTWASATPRDARARWSCVILRVMHTLLHVDNNVYLRFFADIQQQIFDRYDRFLVPTDNGGWLLKGNYEVPLLATIRKERKDRASMLLKLLHKPENVAETIYDQVGIRFVAEDLLGVLAVLRFLLDHHVLMPTHIKPSRTRNLVVDLTELDQWMGELPDGFTLARLSPDARAQLNARLTRKAVQEANPFSASSYSAVQFTARTLIRLPNPASAALQEVQKRLAESKEADMGDRLHIPELIQEQEEFTFFFAHEVQLMEKTGYESVISGPASHTEYKMRQREAVRKRVLQGIAIQEAPC